MALTPTHRQRLKIQDESSRDASTFDTTWQSLGTITENPVIIWFDNDTTVDVQISDDAGTNAFTLISGRQMLWDCRANSGKAANFAFDDNTAITVNAAAGTGNIRMGYIYAR